MRTEISAGETGLFEGEAPPVREEDEPADIGCLSMRRGISAEEAD
jgi:hypothetical protein